MIKSGENNIFWFTLGGKIEDNETIVEAAIRETIEESGIDEYYLNIGPIVWKHKHELFFQGVNTSMLENYIVIRTNQKKTNTAGMTKSELQVVNKIKWWAIKDILDTQETIYPTFLKTYLPDIVHRKYPRKPILM